MTRVRMQVEIEREIDVTAVLDGWTLEEVREFVEDPDPEGKLILANEGEVETETAYRSIRGGHNTLADYLEDREAREDKDA